MAFTISTQAVDAGELSRALRIAFQGRIGDADKESQGPRIRAAVDSAVERFAPRALIIDLAALKMDFCYDWFVSSSLPRVTGCYVAGAKTHANMWEIWELTRLKEAYPIFETLPEAITYLKQRVQERTDGV